jgi:hypothetical protein
MSVDLNRIRLLAPRYPEETPYWPCVFFVHEDEIVAVLFFDDEEVEGVSFAVDAQGLVDEEPVEAPGDLLGWSLHILAEEKPSPVDPRVAAPSVEGWGDDLTIPDVMQRAYAAIEARAEPLGLTYEKSRERLLWTPVGGWPER